MKLFHAALNQANSGFNGNLLAICIELAVYHIERGARKFIPYAKAMIADVGDKIKPYLKAAYNAARDIPKMSNENAVVVLDAYAVKDDTEIVGWRVIDAKGLEKMKKQAEREDGQLLMLSPKDRSAAALSTLPSDAASVGKGTGDTATEQADEEKKATKYLVMNILRVLPKS